LDDQSFAWFDEIKLIQWDDQWQILPLSIPYPNNYKFIRFRADESADIKISGTVVKYQKL
jgi:hypothetical protein